VVTPSRRADQGDPAREETGLPLGVTVVPAMLPVWICKAGACGHQPSARALSQWRGVCRGRRLAIEGCNVLGGGGEGAGGKGLQLAATGQCGKLGPDLDVIGPSQHHLPIG